MSKAFTKEVDNEFEEDLELPEVNPLDKNYVTPFGFSQLQQEIKQLFYDERPKIVEIVKWAAGNGDRSENGDYIYGKKRLREIDKRVRYLKKRIEQAQIVDPELQKNLKRVFFGATVTYKELDGRINTVKIVGIDEADLEKGKISWISPIAKALLKSEVGDIVTLSTPKGKKIKLTIISIKYIKD